MSYGGAVGPEISETFQNFLTGIANFLKWAGGVVSLLAIALLVFYASQASPGSGASNAQVLQFIEIAQKALLVGILSLAVGATYQFWGEELLVGLQLLVSAALYFAPLYLPSIFGNGDTIVMAKASGALAAAGTLYGVIAIGVTVVDVSLRVRERAQKGTRADQLKYGKGIKEETQKQNVLLGKCWQLPFCRKFVKERCPIFHAQVTCWKELVGCMCEESVIRNALENKPIPKDALLARNMIPRNLKLTDSQKRERCKNCVIYNEHQRHKYKIAVPTTVGSFILIYGALHGPLVSATTGVVENINRVVNKGTLGHSGNFQPPQFFVEMLLFVFLLVSLTYAMKVLEFMIFKAKI